MFNDILLKKYVTQLFKRQCNANLIKFNQVQMLMVTTLNVSKLYSNKPQEEINKIEEEIRSSFETPIDYMNIIVKCLSKIYISVTNTRSAKVFI